MDFRHLKLDAARCEPLTQFLNYQPFYLSEDCQTGAAYSWYHTADARVAPPMIFRRSEWSNAEWDQITAANGRQRTMYDAFVRFIADRYPGKVMLDVACNNGYFPVRAEMFGMAPSFGLDLGPHYARSIELLNILCNTHATFVFKPYDVKTHTSAIEDTYDVVVANTIMWHLPDPTYFLAFLGRLAKEAIFMWVHILDTDELLVSYGRPHPNLADPRRPRYPHFFNDFTQISRGLLELAFESMGFPNITYLPWSEDWLLMSPPHDKAGGLDDFSPAGRFGASVWPALRKGDRQVAVLASR